MKCTDGSTPHSARRRSFGIAARSATTLVLALSGAVACGQGFAPDDAEPLDLDGCEAIGGTPLFHPDEERPIELGCPEGLHFLGAFEDDFYGAEGGVCCADLARFDEASAPDAP